MTPDRITILSRQASATAAAVAKAATANSVLVIMANFKQHGRAGIFGRASAAGV